MTPFEFVIPQRPVSQQARRQARVREWKEFVAHHARLAMREPRALAIDPIAISVLYVYDEAALDVDNVLKPIQDALIGVLLDDDSIVTDVEICRRWRGTTFTIGMVTPVLASGLELGGEFVYVLLKDAPPQDVMPCLRLP
jgi:Holliday junction resolvase RusA-like endonuclease